MGEPADSTEAVSGPASSSIESPEESQQAATEASIEMFSFLAISLRNAAIFITVGTLVVLVGPDISSFLLGSLAPAWIRLPYLIVGGLFGLIGAGFFGTILYMLIRSRAVLIYRYLDPFEHPPPAAFREFDPETEPGFEKKDEAIQGLIKNRDFSTSGPFPSSWGIELRAWGWGVSCGIFFTVSLAIVLFQDSESVLALILAIATAVLMAGYVSLGLAATLSRWSAKRRHDILLGVNAEVSRPQLGY